ncbi:MAG TPA: GyrI-like domain-containing protein [Herpetosiphonaceae bacterium]|nr:GyrI-like domain-containing protein [Herpetosiphonaceae bacterium]
MTVVGPPTLEECPALSYHGIRTQTPMKGMFTVVARLRAALEAWMEERQVAGIGSAFLRYHVIDMAGVMDIAVGIPVAAPLPGDGQVIADQLPAGRYARLVYQGHGLTGNKALLAWAAAQGLALDRSEVPEGDAFRARFERYLTDPRVEPRKTKWDIEVAIKLADERVAGPAEG